MNLSLDLFFFSSRRRHTRSLRDWSSDVCSSDLDRDGRVGGLTLLEAHRKVSERARDVFKYADATITVVAPRTFEVTVSGDVEIGRASCRERVGIAAGDVGVEGRGAVRISSEQRV